MKKISVEQAASVVGGDDCSYKNWRWNWSNGYKQCLADYYCTDKHGNSGYKKTEDKGPAACIARGM